MGSSFQEYEMVTVCEQCEVWRIRMIWKVGK